VVYAAANRVAYPLTADSYTAIVLDWGVRIVTFCYSLDVCALDGVDVLFAGEVSRLEMTELAEVG